MLGMYLRSIGQPLVPSDVPVPQPGDNEVCVRIQACGVCRTDLHVCDGELSDAKLPIIPGHEIVGIVEQIGSKVEGIGVGDLVGIPWLAETCGRCKYCRSQRENLCD